MKPVYPAARELPSYENLLLEMVEPNILKVTLNRPKAYNALSHGLVNDLINLSQWLVDEYYNIRVVLLYGGDEGKGFCAGLDVKQGLDEYEQTVPGFYAYQVKLGELEMYMSKTPQPWIALIDNVSAGGGFSLAMVSDIRVCTKTARFSCFYANVGIGGCDMSSSYFLPRLIGTGRAYEMMLTGNFISADEAWNLGLVSKVVEDRPALVPAGLELARVIAAKDPMAVRLTKEAMGAKSRRRRLRQRPAGREPQPDPDDRPQRQQGRFSGSHRQVLDRGSYRSPEPQGCQLIDFLINLQRPPASAGGLFISPGRTPLSLTANRRPNFSANLQPVFPLTLCGNSVGKTWEIGV